MFPITSETRRVYISILSGIIQQHVFFVNLDFTLLKPFGSGESANLLQRLAKLIVIHLDATFQIDLDLLSGWGSGSTVLQVAG